MPKTVEMSPKLRCPKCYLDYPNSTFNREAFATQEVITCEECGTRFRVSAVSETGQLFSSTEVE